ncbi:uncharacterized protein LOC107273397 isoform X2 [Cephus cinctus]|uniref:Uncharacterized protein LOC107273397 isoform X2 n=1 Tax=Cephus cinctus TaxID=211228 RepID=A0AAJ7RTQ8_CEPCN|nr:uncharacterized protein LOC107273397 isoform X2 [Cephus cinctus]XP_024946515.1 uncharacterized protein LOC107273397 isoform X2 [Cephus cinctus]
MSRNLSSREIKSIGIDAPGKRFRYYNKQKVSTKENCMTDNEEGQCVLQTLAKKEKTLRKQIFEMEFKEEGYMKALWDANKSFEQTLDSGKDFEKIGKDPNDCCKRSCDVKEKISQLEAYGRKLCLNLKSLQKNRAELTQEAAVLSKKLKVTKQDTEVDSPIESGGIKASNNSSSACPCGEPVKCNSCIICSCSEWERDLIGGGDEESEEYGDKLAPLKEEKVSLPADRCRCGCYETSSESECECGCCENTLGGSCDCEDSESDQTTITTTTIPSTVENAIRSDNQNRNKDCCLCNADQPCNKKCEICQCETDPRGIEMMKKEENCAMCSNAPQNIQLPCSDPDCNYDTINNISKCSICRSTVNATKDLLKAMQKITSSDSEVPAPINVTPGRQKVKQEKLLEGLENLKNHNETLKNLLKDCGCSSNNYTEDNVCPCTSLRPPLKKTTSGLIETVKLLHNKCRTKDGIILALADELKRNTTEAQSDRILKSLTDPDLCCKAKDFDRLELWKYLELPSQRYNNNNNGRSNENYNMARRDLLFGLIVLFLFIFSHLIRSYAELPSCSCKVFKKLQSCAWNIYSGIIHFFKFLHYGVSQVPYVIVTSFYITRNYVIHVWTSFGSVGAIFGSLSCVRTVWSLVKKIILYLQTFWSRHSLRIYWHKVVFSIKNFFGSVLIAIYVPIKILLVPVYSSIRFIVHIVFSIYLLIVWIVLSIVKPVLLMIIRLQKCIFRIARFVVWCVSTLKALLHYIYTRLFSLPNILFLLLGFTVNRIVTALFEYTF